LGLEAALRSSRLIETSFYVFAVLTTMGGIFGSSASLVPSVCVRPGLNMTGSSTTNSMLLTFYSGAIFFLKCLCGFVTLNGCFWVKVSYDKGRDRSSSRVMDMRDTSFLLCYLIFSLRLEAMLSSIVVISSRILCMSNVGCFYGLSTPPLSMLPIALDGRYLVLWTTLTFFWLFSTALSYCRCFTISC
jgi:hypothetical protein